MVVCILLTLDLECGTIFIQGYLDPESKIKNYALQSLCFYCLLLGMTNLGQHLKKMNF